jgi:hypothetical protein
MTRPAARDARRVETSSDTDDLGSSIAYQYLRTRANYVAVLDGRPNRLLICGPYSIVKPLFSTR